MGRKKIQKMVEIIIKTNNKVFRIPLDKKFDDEMILSIRKNNIDNSKSPNDNKTKLLKNTDEKTKETEEAKDPLNVFFNPDDLSTDLLQNESENEYEAFFNEMDDLYFNMF